MRRSGGLTLLGLPLDAWVLLVAAVGLGLGLELVFLIARRREGRVPER